MKKILLATLLFVFAIAASASTIYIDGWKVDNIWSNVVFMSKAQQIKVGQALVSKVGNNNTNSIACVRETPINSINYKVVPLGGAYDKDGWVYSLVMPKRALITMGMTPNHDGKYHFQIRRQVILLPLEIASYGTHKQILVYCFAKLNNLVK